MISFFLHTAFGQYAPSFNSIANDPFCGFSNSRAYRQSPLCDFFTEMFTLAALEYLGKMNEPCKDILISQLRQKGVFGIDEQIFPLIAKLARPFGESLVAAIESGSFQSDNIKLIRKEGFDEHVHINSPEFLESIDTEKIVLVDGDVFWNYSDGIKKYYRTLVSHFRPVYSIEQNAEKFDREVHVDCDLYIGVHIRHGDYKQWRGGKHFYELKDYLEVMKHTEGLFPDKRIKFLVCSNETFKATEFDDLNVVIGPGNFMEDVYSLTYCDYLMGPPSGFTWWASLYGEKPLCFITSKDFRPTLEDFLPRYSWDNPYIEPR